MSILIKGMDIPKASNEDCVAVIRSNGKVEVWQTGYKERTVEAIQIPKPHGRLIDADETRKQYYQWMEELLQSTTINMSAEALSLLCGFTIINNAPTIIESED